MPNPDSVTGSYAGLVLSQQSNDSIAGALLDYADLLSEQGDGGFRERAYRQAAAVIQKLDKSLVDIYAREGLAGLVRLPTIGKGIAGVIAELLFTGQWAQLERLRGTASPEQLLQSIPGIGPKLASHLIEDAHVETLQELEIFVRSPTHNVTGLGPRKREAIRAILAERLRHPASLPAPSVSLLLQIDELYRQRASKGSLSKIRPTRFNAENKAWLPVMHEQLEGWYFTAMFSNTARAHELAKTSDWVVIYYHEHNLPEGHCTVVTETSGPFKGERVVRGRERETPHVI